MIEPEILKYFAYDHLPKNLQEVSEPFCDLALSVMMAAKNQDEAIMCLRKLLEAKDCAVRAML